MFTLLGFCASVYYSLCVHVFRCWSKNPKRAFLLASSLDRSLSEYPKQRDTNVPDPTIVSECLLINAKNSDHALTIMLTASVSGHQDISTQDTERHSRAPLQRHSKKLEMPSPFLPQQWHPLCRGHGVCLVAAAAAVGPQPPLVQHCRHMCTWRHLFQLIFARNDSMQMPKMFCLVSMAAFSFLGILQFGVAVVTLPFPLLRSP